MLQQAIDRFRVIPRLECGFYPTPIEELPRLRAALGGGPRLWIKRDDYTGPGFGGNKVRKLEYVLARAIAEGADTVITIGGVRSNHARITAALAAKLGLQCILVLSGDADQSASLYLDKLCGAQIHHVASREERMPAMQQLAAQSRHAFMIPLGASTPLGALGYLRAVEEAASQLPAPPDWIFHASSSGGTQAGILAGCRLFGWDQVRVVGVSPDDRAEAISAEVARVIDGIGELVTQPLGCAPPAVDDGFIGPGYSIPTPDSEAAFELLARTEGIVLDPVYTAKAMAALLAAIRQGKIGERESVLFWHTGGQMALFCASRRTPP